MLKNVIISAALAVLVGATGLWIASTGVSIAQEERAKTSPEVLQRTPEREKALRSEFMADLKWLDDIAAQKEDLIQGYMDSSDQIVKWDSEEAASRDKRRKGLLEKLIISQEARQDELVNTYRLLVQREELERSFQGKLIAKPDYLKELHVLEEKMARNEQLRVWREISDVMSIEIGRSLKRIEKEITGLRFASPQYREDKTGACIRVKVD
jgi:hypothetical protein